MGVTLLGASLILALEYSQILLTRALTPLGNSVRIMFSFYISINLTTGLITKLTSSEIKFRRITVTAECQMDLRKFPMDTQVCVLMFESCKYLGMMVTTIHDHNGIICD